MVSIERFDHNGSPVEMVQNSLVAQTAARESSGQADGVYSVLAFHLFLRLLAVVNVVVLVCFSLVSAHTVAVGQQFRGRHWKERLFQRTKVSANAFTVQRASVLIKRLKRGWVYVFLTNGFDQKSFDAIALETKRKLLETQFGAKKLAVFTTVRRARVHARPSPLTSCDDSAF